MKNTVFYYFLFCWLIASCTPRYSGTVSGASFYEPGKETLLSADSGIITEITPYQKELNALMNEVLVHSDVVMEKGKPESLLGNFVADACFSIAIKKYNQETGIDFCFLNNGGLRNSLPSGEITRRNVFELMPFENELVVLTMKGEAIKKILLYISTSGGVPISNLRMKFTDDGYHDVLINGKPFDSTFTYKVVTSDYLANGGDGMNMLSERVNLESLGIKVRDAIIESMLATASRNESLKPVTDGRIAK